MGLVGSCVCSSFSSRVSMVVKSPSELVDEEDELVFVVLVLLLELVLPTVVMIRPLHPPPDIPDPGMGPRAGIGFRSVQRHPLQKRAHFFWQFQKKVSGDEVVTRLICFQAVWLISNTKSSSI
jgi:hypothetical protein